MSFLIGSARTTIASLKNGEIGTPGPAGEDGKTSYVHIAYSNSEDGSLDFSTSDSSNRAYIGMYTDFTELDSTDHTKYTWQRTKGEQGESGRDGVAGKDGVGLKNTEVSYAKSTNGQTPPESGWTEQVPVVPGGQFLWTKTTWTYTDNSSESGYSVAKMGQDGNKGDDGIAGKDGVGISKTVIEYAPGNDGVTKPTTGWTAAIPTVAAGKYLWTRTTWSYTDGTSEVGYTVAKQGEKGDKGDKGDTGRDGIAGKDGVGLRSTAVTYAASTSGTVSPSTGWQEQVPTVAPSNFLWTRTVWTYTDGTSETGYSVAKMGKDGAKGDDGIAGKDGVGINDTLIEYAVNTSGTTKPTSGWSTSIPTVPQGQYLWTRTTWTYTDNTTEQGFTVALQGEKGDKGDQGIAGPKGADGKTQYTHIAYADNANGGGFSQSPTGKAYIGMYVDFEELDSSDPTKYAWSLIKGADGEQGIAGPKGEDGKTPYFHTAYTNSTDFGTYDYSGNPNLMIPLKASDFNKELETSVSDVGYNSIRLTSQGSDRLSTSTSNNIPSLVSGKTYTISAKVKIEEGTTGNIDKIRICYRKINSGTILLHANTKGVEVGKETTIKGTAVVNYEITDLSRLFLSIDTEIGAKINGSVIVSDIKIEEGSTATPYQPNLLDAPWYFSTVSLGKNIADPTAVFPISTSDYLLYNKRNIENYEVGKTYTLTIKATKPATQSFTVFMMDGTQLVGKMTPVEGKIDEWKITFTVDQSAIDAGATNILQVYQYPSETKGACQIDWLKIEKGDTRTPNIDDYKYLGNYTDFVQADSLNPTKYSWNLIKGTSSYLHTAYVNDLNFGNYDYSGNPNIAPPINDGNVFSLNNTMTKVTPHGTYATAEKIGNDLTVGVGMVPWSRYDFSKLTVGKQYSLTVPLRINESYNGDISRLFIRLRCLDKDNNALLVITSMVPRDTPKGVFTNIVATFNVQSSTQVSHSWYVQVGSSGDYAARGTVDIGHEVKIEEGFTATPYQPNIKGTPWYFSKYNLGTNLRRLDAGNQPPFTTTEYQCYVGRINGYWEADETYTVTINATKPATQTFGLYLLNGSQPAGNLTPVEGLTDTWSVTFKVTKEMIDAGVTNHANIFQVPQYTKGEVKVNWVKIEKGSESTPNIDAYTYMGTYSDESEIGSDNPKQYEWKRVKGADGVDGAPAKALTLQADSPVMKFDANDVVVAGQVITFTAIKQNFDSNIAWVATPYKGNTAQPAIALKGTGDVRTLEASMWASGVTTIRVDVSADTFRDSVTITKVKDGAKGDRGNDGIAGKDGVGIRSTAITYAGSASGTTPPTTGWQTQVPTVPAGQFLWTKTVWTYTDNSTETGYSAAMMGKNGAKGDDGIAGKDGVGIKNTVIEYAVNTSGTVKPTSGWTSAVPNTPQGQYLWTRTTWTYTDNTTEQGFTVARQGSNGQNGTNGTNGSDGKPAFFHTAWANSPDGTLNFSKTDSLNKSYIGTYSDSVQAGSNDPSKYKWTELVGALVIDSTNYALESRYNWRPRQASTVESYYNILLDKPIPKGTKIQVGTDYSWVSGNKPTVDGIRMIAITSGGSHAGVELNLKTAPDSGTITMSGTLTAEMSAIRLCNGSSGKGQNNIYQFENTVVNIGDKLCGWQPNYKDTPQRNNLLTNSTGQLGDGNWIIPVNTWEILSPEKDKPTSNIFHSKGSTSVSDIIYQNPHPIQVKAGQIIVVSFDYKENMSCGEMFSIRTFSEANKGPAEYMENWNVPRSLLEKSIQDKWIRVTHRILVRKDGYLDFILANRSSNANAQNWFREIMVTTNGSLQGDYSWYQPDYTSSAVNEANQTIPRVYVQSLAPQKVKDGDQWWKMNNNKITNYYVYGGGKWNEQTIDQSVLNIATLNAVNINGSVVAGSTFVNEYTNVKSGLNQVTDGSLKIENGILQAGSTYYLTNSAGERLYKFATTEADIHQGTVNLRQRLYDDAGKQTSESTTSVSGGLISLSLSDASGNYHGVLDAKALTNTGWKDLRLNSQMAVAEGNPPQYRIFYQLDGSKLIKFRGQVKMKSGKMLKTKTYYPFQNGDPTVLNSSTENYLPAEIRPDRTSFGYAPGPNAGGRIASTTTPRILINPAEDGDYFSIEAFQYIKS